MNNELRKLGNQDMSNVSGGVATKIVYSGSAPSFDHPIRSETLASSKLCENKRRNSNLPINDEVIDNIVQQ